MSDLIDNLFFIFQRLTWEGVIDIFLVAVVFMVVLFFLRNTQAMLLVRGILFLIIFVSLMTSLLNLPGFTWLVNTTLPALLLAIPVIFAPEIRRVLERLGRASNIISNPLRHEEEVQDVVSAVVHAASRLSNRRHGALIVLQRMDSLEEYGLTGVPLDSEVTAELLLQIFYPNTPLHDGAVIIENERITAASCVMPLSASGVLAVSPERKMGLRHRAALGASEVSDGIAVVVSEETGAISIATNGRMIHRLGANRLEGVLRAIYKPLESRGIEHLLARWLPFLFEKQVSEETTEV